MAKVLDNEENMAKCVCPRCPTYLQSDCPKNKAEILYCVQGKTGCGLTERGCICGTCPVFNEYSLADGYFCTRGAAE